MASVRRGSLALAALSALLLATAGAAGASRPPTKSEIRAISRALRSSPATRFVSCFRVRFVVISTNGPWARAAVVPCNTRRFDAALAVLQRRRGNWRVRDLGSSEVGCIDVPPRVRRDLKLLCPEQR